MFGLDCNINENYKIFQYIKQISSIYNSSNDFVSIIDNMGNPLYLSDAVYRLWTSNTKFLPKTLKEFDLAPIEIINEFNNIYLAQTSSTNLTFFRGTKYPIHHENEVIAILTIEYKLKLVNIEHLYDDREYCFTLPGYSLSNIENLILFYASFGFSHGEIYQFVTEHHNSKLNLNNFKYYYKKILMVFKATSIKELIANNEVLNSCRFIPHKLLRNMVLMQNFI
ncbi:MAG: hypothetical protein ACK5Z5_04720 [Neisseriaceae bacterium]